MLSERETYLGQLLVLGHRRKFVAERASMLLNVVEHIHNHSNTQITEGAITSAAMRLQGISIITGQKPRKGSAETSWRWPEVGFATSDCTHATFLCRTPPSEHSRHSYMRCATSWVIYRVPFNHLRRPLEAS